MNSWATCHRNGETEKRRNGETFERSLRFFSGLQNAHIARDGFRRDEIVAGDHEDADAGLLAQRDAVADFDACRILDADEAEEAEILLDGFESADVEELSMDGARKGLETCVRDGEDRCRKPGRPARACRPWPSSEALWRTWRSPRTRNGDEARESAARSFRSIGNEACKTERTSVQSDVQRARMFSGAPLTRRRLCPDTFCE